MNYLTLILTGGLIMGLAACGSDNVPDVPGTETEEIQFAQGDTWEAIEALPEASKTFKSISLSDAERSILSAQNEFALDLFRHLSGDMTANSLLSPVSLSLDLGMLGNGASGKTLADISAMTGLSEGQSQDDLNALNHKLMAGLVSADESSDLSLSNSIWLQKNFEVASDFVEKNCLNYYAGIYRRDLTINSTIAEMNSWIVKNTKGKIPEMLSRPFSDDTHLTLINALFFYGSWVHSFDRNLTSKAKFTCLDGTESQVDMMTYSRNEVTCATGEKLRAVYLPLGNGAYEMTFFLPRDGVSLAEAREALTCEEFGRLAAEKKEQFASLRMPRFDVSGEVRLRDTLNEMGYGNMFTGSADFSRLSPWDGLFVGDILQRSIIKVDEEGATGAAATLIVMDSTSGQDDSLTFDRPFIFSVTECSTGAILFIGDVKQL